MDSALKAQVVLVTGASGAIGQAIARALAAEGTRLILHYHSQGARAEALRAELDAADSAGAPQQHLALSADLRDESEVDGLFDAALRAVPQIDAVIVNAGVWVAAEVPLHKLTLAQWRSTLDADLTAAFLTCRAFLRHLAAVPRAAASIVLVGSTAALFGEAGHADYAAAKAGLVYGLTRTLKNEIVRLAPRGRANCVCPGWVRTPMAEPALADPAVLAQVCATIPMNKVATVEDVANAVVFLTSDRLAGHLSGTILAVAGGMEGRLLNRERPSSPA